MTVVPDGVRSPLATEGRILQVLWKCTDRQLCSYVAVVDGLKYHAQRTFLDTVEVWHGGVKIGTAPNPSVWQDDAARLVHAHVANATAPDQASTPAATTLAEQTQGAQAPTSHPTQPNEGERA